MPFADLFSFDNWNIQSSSTIDQKVEKNSKSLLNVWNNEQ